VAHGLAVWQELDGQAELVIEDDGSDPSRLIEAFAGLVARCDLLLGPYSTQLTRRAAELASRRGLLVWNHGGAGDDVQTCHPGHLVSVLTPASRYARPFLRRLQGLARAGEPARLWIVEGRGSFGRQVAAGAEVEAQQLGIEAARIAAGADLDTAAPYDVLSAGTFEEDVATLSRIRDAATAPRLTCSIAAGVSDFRATPAFIVGTHGITQWLPGAGAGIEVGPQEGEFIRRFRALTGHVPDYPAVQAATAAAIAAECARRAGATTRDALWAAATSLETTTLFGPFKIDRVTGAQIGHETRLAQWTDDTLVGAR
jgi:ABC-type branched-subunit amino acid transport system substrate-binding protein